MPVEIKTFTPSGKHAKKAIKPSMIASDDDKPGYGKPPKAFQWAPGQSGNPSGKPKGAKNLATIVKDEAKGKVIIKDTSGKQKKLSKAEALIRTTMHKALKGDIKATTLMLTLFKEHLPKDVIAESAVATPDELQILQDHAAILGLLDSLESPANKAKNSPEEAKGPDDKDTIKKPMSEEH